MEHPTLEKALPKNAPAWAKRNPLAAISTIVTTLAAAVAIFAWLGWKPLAPLTENEAYVTHEQFNLLMVNLVKSVEKIEKEMGTLRTDIGAAGELAELLLMEKITPPPGVVIDPETEEIVMEAPVIVVEPIPITPNIQQPDSLKPLRGAVNEIESLQMEQRAMRK